MVALKISKTLNHNILFFTISPILFLSNVEKKSYTFYPVLNLIIKFHVKNL